MSESTASITPPSASVKDQAIEDQATIDRINTMSHYNMCALWRFAPSGHPYFDSSKPFADIFKDRLFNHFGGFTPEISKALS